MKCYAVFDTNVLVSALLTKNPDSATAMVLDAIPRGDIIPLFNQDILLEYEDVLRRPKFPFSEAHILALLSMIQQFGLKVSPSPTGEILPDMDDLVFYEVTMEKRRDNDNAYLITGNLRHFPKREYIVTPGEMMVILASL